MKFEGTLPSLDFTPKSLLSLNALELLASVRDSPQGSNHRWTAQTVPHGAEVEVLNQHHDYAVLRTNPSPMIHRPAHWLIGYADEGSLFMHAMPYGDIDYVSEPWWYILSYLNRKEEGYERIQGDLLVRRLAAWEAEDARLLMKEDPYFMESYRCVNIGNAHTVEGSASQPTNDDSGGEKVTTRTRKRERVDVRHPEHQDVGYGSNQEEFREVGMQRRDKRMPNGGAD